MREELAALQAALQQLKRASVFKKAIAAEAALTVAVDLFEKLVEKIEQLEARLSRPDDKTELR